MNYSESIGTNLYNLDINPTIGSSITNNLYITTTSKTGSLPSFLSPTGLPNDLFISPCMWDLNLFAGITYDTPPTNGSTYILPSIYKYSVDNTETYLGESLPQEITNPTGTPVQYKFTIFIPYIPLDLQFLTF